jgi:predicted PurR-regulated permease PerM
VLGSVGFVYVVYLNQATLILLGISFVVAYLLAPSIDRLECLGLSRTLAISLLTGVVLISIGVLFLVIVPQLQHQVQYMAGRAPRWGQWLYDHLTPLLEAAAPPLSQYFGIALDMESLRTYAGHLWDWVMTHLPGITHSILSIFQTMFTGLANFIVGVLDILLVPVMVFYLLRDFGILRARFYALLPPHWRPIVADWLGEIDHALGGFLRGQFTIALTLATIYAVGLALMGVPLGALLGIIAGLANLVPYMSIVAGLVPTLVLSY